MAGPCTPYATGAELVAADDCDLVDEAAAAVFVERASQVLYALTGRQFPNGCQRTVRPVRGECCPGHAGWGPWGGSACNEPIPLVAPVRSVDSVLIDGQAFTDYHVRNSRLLVRHDGEPWPATQKLHLPDTEVDTFSITYTFGAATPDILRAATIELALQFHAESGTGGRNTLPKGTTSASRQGISIQMQQDIETARERGPSLPSVMTALASFNPENRRHQSAVWSPDNTWDLVTVSA
jgi:hypothetical protein